MLPYIVLDGSGEAYVDIGDSTRFSPWSMPQLGDGLREAILIRTAQAGDVTGRLFYPKPDWSGMVIVKFTVPASEAKADARAPFYRAKESYYSGLMSRNIPGGAWFRHEARQARTAQNKQPAELAPAGNTGQPFTFAVPDERGGLAATYALFSGGRAMSENLQLDRDLRSAKPEEATVDVDTIEGITVQEIDWKPLVKDLKPELDPLAALIPADQHVVFFPTFHGGGADVPTRPSRHGTPVLHLAEPRSEDARIAERYQRQLCLSLSRRGPAAGAAGGRAAWP